MLGKVGIGGDPFSLPILNKKKPTTPAVPSAIPAPTPVNINQAVDSGGIKLDSSVKAPVSPTPTIPKPVNPMNAPIIPQIDGGGVGETPIAPKINAQDATGEAKKPAIPQISPEAESALSSAEKAYQDSLKISPEEISTQEDIDKLVEATKSAYRNTSGQAIPLEFITGQLRSIEERATGLAEPLERKLSRMQAARTASLESSKFGLERAQKKVDAEKAAAEKLIPKAPEPFTLSPGEVRYDASGKVVATGGPKPLSDAAQAKALEKQDAAKAGKSASLDNYALVNELLKNPALSQISGLQNPFTIFTPGTEAQTAKNIYGQIKGILSLENRQKLKGSGAISDFESRTLEQAASALGRNLSDAEFQKQLKKIRGAFATSAGLESTVKIKDPATGESQVVQASRAGIDSAIADGMEVEYI